MQKTLDSISADRDGTSANTGLISSASSSFPQPGGVGRTATPILLGYSESTTRLGDESDSAEEGHKPIRLVTEFLGALTLGSDGVPQEFHGESSISSVISLAANGRSPHDVPDEGLSSKHSSRVVPWAYAEVSSSLSPLNSNEKLTSCVRQRDEVQSPAFIFPDPPLLYLLVDLYFTHAHPWFTLLHRPTFYRCLNEGLHHRDRGFGGVVLLVCATGALCSDDPAFLDDDEEMDVSRGSDSVWRSAGWKWARQVDPMRNALLRPPSVYDLQIIVVRPLSCF